MNTSTKLIAEPQFLCQGQVSQLYVPRNTEYDKAIQYNIAGNIRSASATFSDLVLYDSEYQEYIFTLFNKQYEHVTSPNCPTLPCIYILTYLSISLPIKNHLPNSHLKRSIIISTLAQLHAVHCSAEYLVPTPYSNTKYLVHT